MATLYSYVVARDFGFAPNPFHKVCTLATCMPTIRKSAKRVDWVIGTGSKQYKKKNITGCLVYCMQVEDVLTFDEYWDHQDFQLKKPVLNGSRKRQMGDNIYHRENGQWRQENSHHSWKDGTPNCNNLNKDAGRTQNVLVGRNFAYWGRNAIEIPVEFRNYGEHNHDIVNNGRGYKCKFPEELVKEFIAWFETQNVQGVQGEPGRFVQSIRL